MLIVTADRLVKNWGYVNYFRFIYLFVETLKFNFQKCQRNRESKFSFVLFVPINYKSNCYLGEGERNEGSLLWMFSREGKIQNQLILIGTGGVYKLDNFDE